MKTTRYTVHVQPRAKTNTVTQLSPTIFKLKTTASPTDNQANLAVIKLLAQHLNVKRSQLHLISGATSRTKILEKII